MQPEQIFARHHRQVSVRVSIASAHAQDEGRGIERQQPPCAHGHPRLRLCAAVLDIYDLRSDGQCGTGSCDQGFNRDAEAPDQGVNHPQGGLHRGKGEPCGAAA